MQVSLTIIRYPKRFVPIALLAMAFHRLPLWLNKNISFYKLMGSGRNGTFDKHPDWQQWAIFMVRKNAIDITELNESLYYKKLFGNLIAGWFKFFKCETWTVFLEPVVSHGSWDGSNPFGKIQAHQNLEGTIAVLTRATIHYNKLKAFWANVPQVQIQMQHAEGLIVSFGIGEVPFIKQATFSVWSSESAMKAFAYDMQQHKDVIKKTRDEGWYREEMFSRFLVLGTRGSINGIDPLAEIG
ncbi:MAG: spheroidene monooxygenase [Ferruginibacter sp.]